MFNDDNETSCRSQSSLILPSFTSWFALMTDYPLDLEALNITTIPDLPFDFAITIDHDQLGRLLPCHKNILASRSSYFENLWQTAGQIFSCPLDGRKFSRETALLWLRHIYDRPSDLNGQLPSILIQLLLLSCYHNLGALKEAVFSVIQDRLNFRTALDFWANFDIISYQDLVKYQELSTLSSQCLNIIDRYGIVALLRPSIHECKIEMLATIMKRDSLRVNEWSLFTTFLEWAEEKCRKLNVPFCGCNFRRLLGTTFYLIRFPLMRITEIYSLMQSGFVFTGSEYEEILSLKVDHPALSMAPHYSNPFRPSSFSDKPRTAIGLAAKRFRSTKLVRITSCPHEVHQIDLTVNRKVRLIAVGIFAPSFYQISIGKSFVNLQIWNSDLNERMLSVQRRIIHGFTCDQSIFHVVFTSCIYFSPKVRYSLVLIMKHTNWDSNQRELLVLSGHHGFSHISVPIVGSLSNSMSKPVKWKIKPVRYRLEPLINLRNGSSPRKGQFPEIIFDTE